MCHKQENPEIMEKAFVDRIVDEKHAVLLIGESEREHIVPVEALPADATAGVWLKVRFEGDDLAEVVIDIEEQEQTRARIAGKMERLRQRRRRNDRTRRRLR